MKIQLENENSSRIDVKIGFSWTTLFFAFLPAVFRKDFKWAGVQVLAAGLSMGFSCLIFPFIYNRLYIKDLLRKGYLPVTPEAEKVLTEKKMIPESTTGVASNLEPVAAMRRDMYEISYHMDNVITKATMSASEWVAHVRAQGYDWDVEYWDEGSMHGFYADGAPQELVDMFASQDDGEKTVICIHWNEDQRSFYLPEDEPSDFECALLSWKHNVGLVICNSLDVVS